MCGVEKFCTKMIFIDHLALCEITVGFDLKNGNGTFDAKVLIEIE